MQIIFRQRSNHDMNRLPLLLLLFLLLYLLFYWPINKVITDMYTESIFGWPKMCGRRDSPNNRRIWMHLQMACSYANCTHGNPEMFVIHFHARKSARQWKKYMWESATMWMCECECGSCVSLGIYKRWVHWMYVCLLCACVCVQLMRVTGLHLYQLCGHPGQNSKCALSIFTSVLY